MTLRTERLHRKAAVGALNRADSSPHHLRQSQASSRTILNHDSQAASSSSAFDRRDLASQVTALGNGTRIALTNGYSGGQQTYVCPIQIQDQQFGLQVDTGSADLWIASTSCHDDPCRNKGGTPPTLLNVNSDGFQAADSNFGIEYLYGSASGPIYTANVTLGNMTLVKQAFAAASSVSNEDLGTGKFSGVLGLSLPADSVEQEVLNKAEQNDNPLNAQSDPSFTGSPLPGLWSDAPAGTRFFALGLQRRPEEGGVGDSVLTFGAHDPAYAPDPTKIAYQSVVLDTDSIARYWRTSVTEIVVTVGNNFTSSINLSPSVVSSATVTGYPSAILDSGAPISFGPSSVLNSMYGAFGINPAENGWFYMPCATQLNISMTINGAVIPIHPLDASLFAGVDNTDNCLGSFQSLATLPSGAALPADFIIAAPVMRSMYTVFTCDGLQNPPPGAAGPCRPRIGMLSTVTNHTLASEQFYKVRVLKQALGSSTDGNSGTFLDDSGGLSSGVKVLIGCLSALVVIVLLFLGLLFLMKRRRKAEERLDAANAAAAASPTLKATAGSTMARTNTLGGRKSTGGFVSRRHPSEASASAFASSSRSRSKMHLADDDEHYNYSPQEPTQHDNATLAMDPKYRAVAQMHGVYLDEVDDDLIGPSPARDLRGPRVIGLDEDGNHLGVGNAGLDALSGESNATYFEARAIKNDYLRRHPSLQSITPNEGPASDLNRPEQESSRHERDTLARNQSLPRNEDIPLDDLPPRHAGNLMRDSTLSAIPGGGGAFLTASRSPDQLRLQPLGFSRQYGLTQPRGSPEPLLDPIDLQDGTTRR